MNSIVDAQDELQRAALSSTEQQRRRQAVDYARASVALEGFVASEEYRREEERYVRGEITASELKSAADAYAHSL